MVFSLLRFEKRLHTVKNSSDYIEEVSVSCFRDPAQVTPLSVSELDRDSSTARHLSRGPGPGSRPRDSRILSSLSIHCPSRLNLGGSSS
jgi:hypothetical protein